MKKEKIKKDILKTFFVKKHNGYIHTEEINNRISKAVSKIVTKSWKNPDIRKKRINGMKKRIKEKGYWHSPKTRKKISNSMKKRWKNLENIKKQKESIKKCWQDTEYIKKQKKAREKKSYKNRFKNKKYSKKRSEIAKKIWENSEYRTKQMKYRQSPKFKQQSKDRMKKTRAKIIFPKKDSTIEIKIQNFLKELNIEFFTHQYMKEIEHGYQCDILIPKFNMVIECDGDYWHKYPVGLERDHMRTKELLEKRFRVLRLWENEIRLMDVNQFKERLQKEVLIFR